MSARINLALQGGGAHGAFTWGVCDRLLQDDGPEIAGLSGTSAGAMNAAAIKAGLALGSRQLARENLDWFWGRVARVGDLRLTTWMTALMPGAEAVAQAIEYSPGFAAYDALMRAVSPYAYGPFYRNPLEPIVRDMRFDAVCAPEGPALFVNATNVRTGKVAVFQGGRIGPETLLAAACLPTLFKAVEIDGDPHWDGGYTGNPALFPLFNRALPDDVVIVNINPLERPGTPMAPQEIQNRINEIGFNTSLLRELRAIEFVQRLVTDGKVPQGAMKRVNVHMIADDAIMARLSVATKLVPTLPVLTELREAGRRAADAFLSRHGDDLGRGSSVDLRAMFS